MQKHQIQLTKIVIWYKQEPAIAIEPDSKFNLPKLRNMIISL